MIDVTGMIQDHWDHDRSKEPVNLWVRFFGITPIRNSDPRSPGSWCIKEGTESLSRVDSSVPLMHHDPSDLGLLMRIRFIPKESNPWEADH